VLEVRLPDLSGPELQHQLAAAQVALPLIFLTAHGTIPLAVRAMKAGAREFLCKPVHEQELLAAIQQAIEQDRTVRPHRAAPSPLQLRYDALTPRERQVLPLVTSGLVNKQVGEKLGRSERTINVHRAAVMDEMGADSLADLVRMARRLDTVATEA
jgi:FixJ family two-component response regulator